MELLEYQAKELFKMVDIPILPSQTIQDSRQLKQLQIPYPVVLKSQVRSGGRGKAGGVRFVANTIDAIAAARTIFKLSILGEYPEVILAEAHYNTQREIFLAIVLDYSLQRPVLLGSAAGGMNIDSLLANLQQVVIKESFSLFYARRLAAKMGLSGQLICSVSEILAKMYRLFVEKDLDLIEINPLGVNSQEELMALDGKITINDRGFARQPEIKALNFSASQKQAQASFLTDLEQDAVAWRRLNWQNKSGKIATVCNSFDLSLLTWDLLQAKKLNPAGGVVIANQPGQEQGDGELYQAKIGQIIADIVENEENKGIKAIFFNIRETTAINQAIIQAVCIYCNSQIESASATAAGAGEKTKFVSATLAQPQFILRLVDVDNLDRPMPEDMLDTPENVYLTSNLEAAVTKAIRSG